MTKIAKALYIPKARTDLEEYLVYGGFGRVEQEVQFHPSRKWKADFFLPDQTPPVIIEYDGLTAPTMRGRASLGDVGTHGAHNNFKMVASDSEKGNEAQALGYRFYRVNAKSLGDHSEKGAYAFLARVLERIDRDDVSVPDNGTEWSRGDR